MRTIFGVVAWLAAAVVATASRADLMGSSTATLPNESGDVFREIAVGLNEQGATFTCRMVGDGTPISEGGVSDDSVSFAAVGSRGEGISKGQLIIGELRAVPTYEGDDEHARSIVFRQQPGSRAREQW